MLYLSRQLQLEIGNWELREIFCPTLALPSYIMSALFKKGDGGISPARKIQVNLDLRQIIRDFEAKSAKKVEQDLLPVYVLVQFRWHGATTLPRHGFRILFAAPAVLCPGELYAFQACPFTIMFVSSCVGIARFRPEENFCHRQS